MKKCKKRYQKKGVCFENFGAKKREFVLMVKIIIRILF